MAIDLRSKGARATILPEHGGRLHQLFVGVNGKEEPLLVVPAELDTYRARPTFGGSFPMAPWPNRIRNGRFRWGGRAWQLPTNRPPHAIHGLGLAAEWELLYLLEDALMLQHRVGPGDGWPWPCTVLQRYTLLPASLRMEMQIHADSAPFPAGSGWHPWFRRDVLGAKSVRLTVPAAKRYSLEGHLPTGEAVEPVGDTDLRSGPQLGDRRLDDCYRALAAPVVIDWGALVLNITVECPDPHVMVYTPPEAICVEPQSCAPDAFNLADRGLSGVGMAVAAPGRPVTIATEWSWSAG